MPAHLVVSVPTEVVADAPKVSPMGDTMEAVEQDALATYYRAEAVA